jgi:hypothetical protein
MTYQDAPRFRFAGRGTDHHQTVMQQLWEVVLETNNAGGGGRH